MSFQRELVAFIRQHLPSVWALELLLLLRRQPDRAWSVDALVRELRASEAIVTRCLTSFMQARLIAEDADGQVRYAPGTEDLAARCDAVEDAFKTRPVALIGLISAPADRLQTLADAFRLKGDPK